MGFLLDLSVSPGPYRYVVCTTLVDSEVMSFICQDLANCWSCDRKNGIVNCRTVYNQLL